MNLHHLLSTQPKLFLPLLFRLAARVEQLTWEEFFADPSYLTFALKNAQKLFRYHWIINHFDPALEVEALGCQVERDAQGHIQGVKPVASWGDIAGDWETRGHLPIVMEATRRLCLELRNRVPVIGVITGPLTIASSLWGCRPDKEALQFAGGVVSRLCQRYSQLGVGGILIAESPPITPEAEQLLELPKLLQPLRNITHYYQLPIILAWRDEPPAGLSQAGVDFLLKGRGASPHEVEQGGEVGLLPAISEALLSGQRDELQRWLEGVSKAPRLWLGTTWEVPWHTPVENLHLIMSYLGG